MSTAIKQRLWQYWYHWVKKRGTRDNPQHLKSRNLYILPSLFGWVYAVVLLTLFLCAVNYQMSAIFLLTFIPGVAGLISAWEAHANLQGLSISFLTINDIQQGETTHAVFYLKANGKTRFNLCYQIKGQEKTGIDMLPPEGKQLVISLHGKRRGHYKFPVMCFYSDYPFGLFRVWGYAFFDRDYYVYPAAVSPGFWPAAWTNEGDRRKSKPGHEDLDNLKPVDNPWIQSNRIAWKIAARGQGWYLKTMNDPEGDCWLFRLDDLPDRDIEHALEHLSYWLHDAERRGLLYALEIKGIRTSFSQGTEHLKQCLRQLAMY
ncbi:hypothetical protein [Legionella spiritensis]|uniref:hypothetical protein n=1 Tax=Legionella spiritensis TaxID=452 RepID=UPI000F71BB2D|nr:hypothetical protein [Legionella spiritensis]VEG90842.1 transmembrane protein [Legionella spiritensis]